MPLCPGFAWHQQLLLREAEPVPVQGELSLTLAMNLETGADRARPSFRGHRASLKGKAEHLPTCLDFSGTGDVFAVLLGLHVQAAEAGSLICSPPDQGIALEAAAITGRDGNTGSNGDAPDSQCRTAWDMNCSELGTCGHTLPGYYNARKGRK